MKYITSAVTLAVIASITATLAVPMQIREEVSAPEGHTGIVAHAFNGAVIVSGGVPTRDFESLSDEEKEAVIAACPAFVDGVDGSFDTACF